MFGRPNIRKLRATQDVAGLGKALAHEDPAVRRAAVVALAAISDEKAAEAAVCLLFQAINDKDETVRMNAEVVLDRPDSAAVRRAIVRRRRGEDLRAGAV